ncbi:hypothetical protein HGRIS_004944 [Hohenbuehelia grisea]|uniref:tRNA pseudouridine synthase n=1 Tax=Hohenbuehelia grisea TaxID=104357 RepID=A0ABR3JF45_9AGAR
MISALVLTCRTGAPPKIIDELYGPQTVLVPKMPSLGLLLEYPIFDSYNTRVQTINTNVQPTDSEYRPAIDFEKFHDHIADFKQKFIYENMRQIEDQFGIFDAWIRSVDKYGGQDLLWLNKNGVIPPAAEVKKGQRRENPFREKRRFDSTAFPAQGAESSDAVQALMDEDEDEDEVEVELSKEQLLDAEG